jgi:hypothetical protein
LFDFVDVCFLKSEYSESIFYSRSIVCLSSFFNSFIIQVSKTQICQSKHHIMNKIIYYLLLVVNIIIMHLHFTSASSYCNYSSLASVMPLTSSSCMSYNGLKTVPWQYTSNCVSNLNGNRDYLQSWASCSPSSSFFPGDWDCFTPGPYIPIPQNSPPRTDWYAFPATTMTTGGFNSLTLGTTYYVGYWTLSVSGVFDRNLNGIYTFVGQKICTDFDVLFNYPLSPAPTCISPLNFNVTVNWTILYTGDKSSASDWFAVYETNKCDTSSTFLCSNSDWGYYNAIGGNQVSGLELLTSTPSVNFRNRINSASFTGGTFAVYYLNGNIGTSGTHLAYAQSTPFTIVPTCVTLYSIMLSSLTCISPTNILSSFIQTTFETTNSIYPNDFLAFYLDSSCSGYGANAKCTSNHGPRLNNLQNLQSVSVSLWSNASTLNFTKTLWNYALSNSFANSSFAIYYLQGPISSSTFDVVMVAKTSSFSLNAMMCGSMTWSYLNPVSKCVSLVTGTNVVVSFQLNNFEVTMASSDRLIFYPTGNNGCWNNNTNNLIGCTVQNQYISFQTIDFLPDGLSSGSFVLNRTANSSLSTLGQEYGVFFIRNNTIVMQAPGTFIMSPLCANILLMNNTNDNKLCISPTNYDVFYVKFNMSSMESSGMEQNSNNLYDMIGIFQTSDCNQTYCKENTGGSITWMPAGNYPGGVIYNLLLNSSSSSSNFTLKYNVSYQIVYGRVLNRNSRQNPVQIVTRSDVFITKALCMNPLGITNCITTSNFQSIAVDWSGTGFKLDQTQSTHWIGLYKTSDCSNNVSCTNDNYISSYRFLPTNLSFFTMRMTNSTTSIFIIPSATYSYFYLNGSNPPYQILGKSADFVFQTNCVSQPPYSSANSTNNTYILSWKTKSSSNNHGIAPLFTPHYASYFDVFLSSTWSNNIDILQDFNQFSPSITDSSDTKCGFVNMIDAWNGTIIGTTLLSFPTSGCNINSEITFIDPIVYAVSDFSFMFSTLTGASNGFGAINMIKLQYVGTQVNNNKNKYQLSSTAQPIYNHKNELDVTLYGLVFNNYNGSDTNLYGCDFIGLFKLVLNNNNNAMTMNATKTYLYIFSESQPIQISGPLTFYSNQCIYGTSKFGGNVQLGMIFRYCILNQTFQVLYSFKGVQKQDGSAPIRKLVVQSENNRLLGISMEGGVNGFGSIFELSTITNQVNLLYSFKGMAFNDGAFPVSNIVLNKKPNSNVLLYGTTIRASNLGWGDNSGTLFRLLKNGTYQNLYSFNSSECYQPTGLFLIPSSSVSTSIDSLYLHCFSGPIMLNILVKDY